MRTATWLCRAACGLALVLLLAGCTGKSTSPGIATAGSPGAPATSPAPLAGGDTTYRFIECMHQQGIDIPQPPPRADGVAVSSLAIPGPDQGGPPAAKVDAALKVCQKYMPNGGQLTSIPADQLAAMIKHSQCMRANGIADFPDPDRYGGLIFNIKMINEPGFDAADRKCSVEAPEPTASGPLPTAGG